MAALRQLLNARGITKETPSEEDQRRNDAKMQAMAYSISSPIPTRLRTSRSEDQGQRPFNPKYNNHPPSAWQQHSLYRGDQADAANAFDHSGDSSRPQLSRSATDDHLHQSLQPYNLGHGRMPSNGVSSYYGEDESPLMSPALNNHLALLPLQPHAQEQHHQPPATQAKHGRRHSKSATADDVHYGADREDNHKEKRKAHKPRQESLRDGSSKPLPDTNSSPDQKTRAMQLIRDRQKSPSLDSGNGRFMPQPLIVPTNEATKISHPFSGSDGSPTDSVGNSISSHSDTSRKRKRSLDYTPAQLSEMEYVTLNTESFDIVPGKVPSHTLPDANMPLHDRLHQIYADRTQKDKASRARGFFASLTIDQYEECGDLLLDGFKNVMERLKQARQQKRKAARMMEEQVAQREEWVRKKRGVCEMELGRLRSAGSAVVKPVKSR